MPPQTLASRSRAHCEAARTLPANGIGQGEPLPGASGTWGRYQAYLGMSQINPAISPSHRQAASRQHGCASSVATTLWPVYPTTSATTTTAPARRRSEEHTSELQSRQYLVCRLLLEKKNKYLRQLAVSDPHLASTRHISLLLEHSHLCLEYPVLRLSI